jgi:hypothetical protein
VLALIAEHRGDHWSSFALDPSARCLLEALAMTKTIKTFLIISFLGPGLLASCKSSDKREQATAETPPAPAVMAAKAELPAPKAAEPAKPEPAKAEPAAAPVALTEVVIPELGVALDYVADPKILDMYADDTLFSVSAKPMPTLRIANNGAFKDETLAKIEERTARQLGAGEVQRKEETKDAWTFIYKSSDKHPQWGLSTKRKVGKKAITCSAQTWSEAELTAALKACESLRVAKK